MQELIPNPEYIDAPRRCNSTGIGAYVAPTSRQVLEEKLKHRLKEVDEVKAAIAFFDANPTFEQGLNLLQKALR